MAEAVGILAAQAAAVRSHQLLAHQAEEPSADLRPIGLGRELRDRSTLENPAHHCRPFGNGALFGRQTIQPRGQ